MAQPATNAKIEELRFRLKADPKSRLFYPLAEEMRKAGMVTEAEQVLRQGLTVHTTYLSAWVSLGRVLRDQKKDGEAVEALSHALQLDPGNVVAARLLGDAHLSLGDKVEAIKKYKLVHALMPGDQELEAMIESLDLELHPPAPSLELAPTPEGEPEPASLPGPEPTLAPAAFPAVEEESLFDRTMPPFGEAARVLGEQMQAGAAAGDAEPMLAAHDESPFEEPLSGFAASALTVEAPIGMHVEEAPVSAEVPAPAMPAESPAEEADVFAPAEDVSNTLTMADLYARQGAVDDARQIYETLLARDPANEEVQAKLHALDASGEARSADSTPQASASPADESANPKIARLESWLSRVSRKEAPGV